VSGALNLGYMMMMEWLESEANSVLTLDGVKGRPLM
jgi:hypothetical protein